VGRPGRRPARRPNHEPPPHGGTGWERGGDTGRDEEARSFAREAAGEIVRMKLEFDFKPTGDDEDDVVIDVPDDPS
jgi:hypothetical protein